MERELGLKVPLAEVEAKIKTHFEAVFDVKMVE
jgi:hypothetical protein